MPINNQSLTRIYQQSDHKWYSQIEQMRIAMWLMGLDQYDSQFTILFGICTWDFRMVELLESPIHTPKEIRQLMMQRMLNHVWPRESIAPSI